MQANTNEIFKVNEDQRAEIEKRKNIFRACFSTQAGQEILAYFQKKYLDRPVCVIDNIYYGYIREGQNDVVREIQNMLKK